MAHVASIGWQSWKSRGQVAGTTGKSKAIEAVKIKLSASLSNFFDIYYRAHVASKGWLGWAKNGEIAGTTGGGIRAEAIQIEIVAKNSAYNRGGVAYIDASKKSIKLQHYMTTSLNQNNYPAFTQPYGYNAGCCATSYAIGLSILNKKSYNPTSFWYGGTTHYDAGRVGNYISYNATSIYNALKNGKPTMLHYYYGNNGEHWIIIIGINSNANLNNIATNDFIIIDPSGGKETTLNNAYKFSNSGIKGIKIFS